MSTPYDNGNGLKGNVERVDFNSLYFQISNVFLWGDGQKGLSLLHDRYTQCLTTIEIGYGLCPTMNRNRTKKERF